MYCEGTEVSEESGGRDDLCTAQTAACLLLVNFFYWIILGAIKK